MSENTKKKRVIKHDKFVALDSHLDNLSNKDLTVNQSLLAIKPKLLKASDLGYSHKQLANIASQITGVEITSADIKKAIANNPDKPKKTVSRHKDKPDGDNPKTIAIASEDTVLLTTYEEKDIVKSLGARYDNSNKTWYVPKGFDITPFKKWLPTS
jgi:hypothetical protein